MRSPLTTAVLLLALPAVAAGQTGRLDRRFAAGDPAAVFAAADGAELVYRDQHERYDRHDTVSGSPESTLSTLQAFDPAYPPQIAPGAECPCPPGTMPLPAERSCWIERLQTGFTAAWLPGSGDDLGMTTFDVYSTFGIGTTGLMVTPAGGVAFVDGPLRTDLPPRLYNLSLDVAWQTQVDDRLALELAVTPTYFSDFERSNSDAFRLLGRAIAFYALNERTQLVLGAMYLDVGDIPFLPVAGVICSPSDDVRYELVFPQPVIGRRIDASECRERWLYLSGEFGGGSWAVERAWGDKDVASYSDWRVLAGLETRYAEGRGWRIEAGYVFGRWLDYDSGLGNYEPDSTVLVRTGFWF